MSRSKMWEEYIVQVESPHFPGHTIPMCGLCGNTGVLDTTASAKSFGQAAGVRAHCICPNGRSGKRRGLAL